MTERSGAFSRWVLPWGGAGSTSSAVLNALLDGSIVFSYDRTGYRRHATKFIPGELDTDQMGRVAVVTGASSGLGIEITRGLLARGADVIMACRDRAKGERVLAELGRQPGKPEVRELDVSDFGSIRKFVEGLPSRIDLLVHNAGSLLDAERRTADGLEATVATHLVGPFLLTQLCWTRLGASNDARVIHVSSGGMYAERLEVDTLFDPPRPFDGVRQYARAKRAQIVVSERLHRAAGAAGRPITVSAMHPGWADTPGVKSSLPRFHTLTRWILRTPAEGADTVLFLALAARARSAGGQFYFDREPQPLHLRRATEETPAERERLWSRLVALTHIPEGAFS